MFKVTRSAVSLGKMMRSFGGITTGSRNGKPYAEISTGPLTALDCDRNGYLPVNKLSEHVFGNRSRIYKNVTEQRPCPELFRRLKKLNSDYFTFITTVRTQIDDNLYSSIYRRGYEDQTTVVRVQLLHFGNSSYSIQNEILHEGEPEQALATVVHHVTLIDQATRRPVKLPADFLGLFKDYALSENLPYRIQLNEPNDIHHYETTVRWSDTDGYKHMSTLSYLRVAVDAYYDAFVNGKFKAYADAQGAFRVQDFQMRFIKETLQGQTLEMQLWEGPVGVLNLRLKVEGNIVNECQMTSKDHPSGVVMSRL